MSVSIFFGLPGAGKTTLLTYFAIKFVKEATYENVYHNVIELKVPGATYVKDEYIGKYEIGNGVLLIDEATLFADSRDWKNFSGKRLEYFLKHRHHMVDIYLFTQQWDGVDRKIRVITDRCYYIYKGFWTGKWLSCYYKIPYDIIIPDPHKKGTSGEKLGEIVQGYAKPHPLIRLLCTKRIARKKYYDYFDSFYVDPLPPLPIDVEPYQEAADEEPTKTKASILEKLKSFFSKTPK